MGPWWLGVGRGPAREERVESCRGDGFASSVQLPSLASPSCSQQSELLHRHLSEAKDPSTHSVDYPQALEESHDLCYFIRIISQHPPRTDGPNRLLQACQPLPGAASAFIVCPQKLNCVSWAARQQRTPLGTAGGWGVALTIEHGDRVGFLFFFFPFSAPPPPPLPTPPPPPSLF